MAKLTLRDLFAVVTVVAVALGWWLDHRRQAALHTELQRENEALHFGARALKAELETHPGYSVKIGEDGNVEWISRDEAVRSE
jgi:hypothetical protein